MTPIDILLVDDEARNLDVLEAILEDPAYRLIRAQDADQALKALLEHDVAAIVLDIKMPGVSGLELAETIKATKRFRQIPIVFLTAYLVDDRDIITGYGAGAVDYLTKPVKPDILRHKVAVFADLFRKTRALAELNEHLEARVRERTAELERSEAALREASRQKDEFIAILAHELRNPLAPLRTGIDLIQTIQPDAEPAVEKTLATMGRQLDHMVRLIDDLLDVSRISRGVITLKKEHADLRTIITTAVDSARPFFERRNQRVEVRAPVEVFAEVDPIRVVQILGNILHNASKFTPERGQIRVELAREGDRAIVRVIDDGIGMDPNELESIFDLFVHLKGSTTKEQRGLGIGLGLARRLAEMHGGTLVASSEGLGRGSTFTLTLRASEAPRAARAPAKAAEPPPTARRILVIEDNADIAETLSALISRMGHRVSTALNGTSGLAEILAEPFDLVLCDLGLPDIDGLEVCRRVRERRDVEQPVMIALTGWGRDDDRRRTKEAGFDGHLVKPVDLKQLASTIASLDRQVHA